MQVACGQCGAQYNLDDKKIAGHPRVQFRCTKCGQTTVVEVAKAPEATQSVSPLPDFARGTGPSPLSTTMVSQYSGLALPANKTITISILSGPSKGLTHTMTKPRAVIGRAGANAGADIEVDDTEVSRWHCAVEVKDDVVRLKDLDSTNGTFLNDERVRAAELEHLTEFRIGSTAVLITITPKHEGLT
jgi:predicted Zn finger-like uncharacterized protein